MDRLRLDLLIKNGCIITNDANKTVIKNGMIGVKDHEIEFIKSYDEDISTYETDEIIDAKGMVIFPGFINTHIHIFQSFLKGLGADHELIEWLNLSALPYGVKMTPYQQYLAAQLASMEAIKTGCTTLTEFFYTNQSAELAHSVIEGMASVGIRSVFVRTFQDTGHEYGMPKCFIEPVNIAMQEVEKLRKKYLCNKGGMLDIWTGPDVTWSTTKEGYQGMLEYCNSENVNYSMHLVETTVDDEMCQKNYGKNIIDLLEEIGFLSNKLLAVHCVNLKDEDIKRFAKYGVSISHNPAPNLYLGSGIPPIAPAMNEGVNISIGTDGAASNNTTNMLESMKLAALMQKGFYRKASIITAGNILDYVTIGGAKALHKEKEVGTLEVGKKADIVLFNPDQLISTPMHDPLATLVYSAEPANIHCTIINGKVVYYKGKFTNGVEEQTVIENVKAEIDKLVRQ